MRSFVARLDWNTLARLRIRVPRVSSGYDVSLSGAHKRGFDLCVEPLRCRIFLFCAVHDSTAHALLAAHAHTASVVSRSLRAVNDERCPPPACAR